VAGAAATLRAPEASAAPPAGGERVPSVPRAAGEALAAAGATARRSSRDATPAASGNAAAAGRPASAAGAAAPLAGAGPAAGAAGAAVRAAAAGGGPGDGLATGAAAGGGGVKGGDLARGERTAARAAPAMTPVQRERYRADWARAQAALGQERVPPALRQYVSDYFAAIRTQGQR
jgi:hypothetical protein